MTGKQAILAVTCASPAPRSEEDNQFPLLIQNLKKILAGSGYTILQVVKLPSSWEIGLKKEEIEAYVKGMDFGIKPLPA
jgi:archaellum biogenesis protein FlaJ (TadC family)